MKATVQERWIVETRISILEDLANSLSAGDPDVARVSSVALSELAVARQSLFHRTLTGAVPDRAWIKVHAATSLLLRIQPPELVFSQLPSLVALIDANLKASDQLRLSVQSIAQRAADGHDAHSLTREDQGEISAAVASAYDALRKKHRRLRCFIRASHVLAVLLAIIAVAIAVIGALSPSSAPPICLQAESVLVCPSREVQISAPDAGSRGARGFPTDYAVVEGLGALGGALAAAIMLRHVRSRVSPYHIQSALAALTVACAPLSAVIGLLALREGIPIGLSPLSSQRQVLAYAMVFGYAGSVALTRPIHQIGFSLVHEDPDSAIERVFAMAKAWLVQLKGKT